MENDRKKLNLLAPFIALSVITMIIIVLFTLLSNASERRKQAVHDTYYKETKDWITKNQTALETVFLEIMPGDYECQSTSFTTVCPQGKSVAGDLSSDIKDYSSTMFLKRLPSGKIISMQLSGTVNEVYPGQQGMSDFQKILSGETETLPWDEYFYELQGKEILVPVKKDGKVIGVIIRGVVEKR